MGRARLSDQEENKIVSELEDKFRTIPDIKFWFGGHFFIELPAEINVDKLPTMENKMKKLTVEQKAKVIKFAKTLVDKKIIKENNNYTMISALREIADDLLLQTELLIDRQYGKVEHDAFKNQWYKTANEFEKKFKTIIKSLMKSGQ